MAQIFYKYCASIIAGPFACVCLIGRMWSKLSSSWNSSSIHLDERFMVKKIKRFYIWIEFDTGKCDVSDFSRFLISCLGCSDLCLIILRIWIYHTVCLWSYKDLFPYSQAMLWHGTYVSGLNDYLGMIDLSWEGSWRRKKNCLQPIFRQPTSL